MNSICWTRLAAQRARSIRPDRLIALECAISPLLRLPDCGFADIVATGPETFQLEAEGFSIAYAWARHFRHVLVFGCALRAEADGLDDGEACVVPRLDVTETIEGGDALIPHDVVIRALRGATCARAWREYLRVTQFDLASRLGVSQPTLSASERTDQLRRKTRERLATALNISEQQLSF